MSTRQITLREVYLQARREAFRDAAQIAGGHTGPGNTFAGAEAYSNACREIRARLLEEAEK